MVAQLFMVWMYRNSFILPMIGIQFRIYCSALMKNPGSRFYSLLLKNEAPRCPLVGEDKQTVAHSYDGILFSTR